MVVTVTVAVTALGPLGVTEAGETEQFALVGAPVQLSATVPVNPPVGLTLTVYVVVWPAVIVCDPGEPESAKSPVTASVTDVVCDKLPLAPVMVTVKLPIGVVVAVVTVSVEELPVVVFGLKLAVAPVGNPEALKSTVTAKPLREIFTV